MDLLDIQLNTFLARLGSGEATPGGGAAAGIVGAQSAALFEMVCHLTADLKAHAPRLAAHRAAFVELAEADIRAFGAVSAAYGLPRSTAALKAARSLAIEEGLRGAMAVPLETLSQVEEMLQDAARVARETNPNVASDAGIALVLAQATLDAAYYNVRINARFLKDRVLSEEALSQSQALMASCGEVIAGLREQVEPHMSRR